MAAVVHGVLLRAIDRVDEAGATYDFTVRCQPPLRGVLSLRVDGVWLPSRHRRRALPYVRVLVDDTWAPAMHGSSPAAASGTAMTLRPDDWYHPMGIVEQRPGGADIEALRVVVTKPNGTLVEPSPCSQDAWVERAAEGEDVAIVLDAPWAVAHEAGDVVVVDPEDPEDPEDAWLGRAQGHVVVRVAEDLGKIWIRGGPGGTGVRARVTNESLQPCVALSATLKGPSA